MRSTSTSRSIAATWSKRGRCQAHRIIFAHFRHGFPRSEYKESAALVELSGSASVSDVTTDPNGYFVQSSAIDLHLKNIASDAVDITDADLIRTYNGWFWPDIPWRLQPMFDPDQILSAE